MTLLPYPHLSSSGELRRRQQREERKERLSNQVQAMKEKLVQQEQKAEIFTSEWSLPWLVLGFAVMVGYCVYYIFS